MNRFVPYSYKDNIARTYYGTVNFSYEPAFTWKPNDNPSYFSTGCGVKKSACMSLIIVCARIYRNLTAAVKGPKKIDCTT